MTQFVHWIVAASLGSFSLFWAPSASGGAFDVFGVHPEGLAEVSARSAAAEDGSASFYNPGGLAFGDGDSLRLSGLLMYSALSVQDEARPLQDPRGGTLTLSADVPLEGPLSDRIRVGVALYALQDRLLRLRTRNQSTPFFPYYDNRTQRFTTIPALSVRVTKWLGIGAGVNVLAGVKGPIDVREGQSSTLETHMSVEATTVARAVVGVRVDPADDVHLAAAFRQRFGIPLRMTTTADIAGVPLLVGLSSSEVLFDPATFVLGGRVDVNDRVSAEVDLTYQQWSSWEGPLLQVDTKVSALSLASKRPIGIFQDTFGVRAAMAWQIIRKRALESSLHFGCGYETSAIDASVQQGRSNFADGAKAIGGVGLRTRIANVFGGLRVGVGLQVHHVGQYSQDKILCTSLPCPEGSVVGSDSSSPSRNITNPGYPQLEGGGFVYAATFGGGVGL